MKNKKIWFKAKLYGWGWRPASWQGWVVTIIYVLALVSIASTADKASHSVSDTLLAFAPGFIVVTIFFLIICYTKGVKPHWRWGK